MNTKLTLMLEKRVIERAKAYARRHRKSLSGMVENYFKNLTDSAKTEDEDVPELVKSLKGIAKMPDNFDYKKDYAKHLEDKYK
jgi:hypothetical protein